jgi:hypothetical protein
MSRSMLRFFLFQEQKKKKERRIPFLWRILRGRKMNRRENTHVPKNETKDSREGKKITLLLTSFLHQQARLHQPHSSF